MRFDHLGLRLLVFYLFMSSFTQILLTVEYIKGEHKDLTPLGLFFAGIFWPVIAYNSCKSFLRRKQK